MRCLNINIGILGHVDSGKTSLAKALSTVASTSAFDKNPQSKRRGITLDLGFSSFSIDAGRVDHAISSSNYDKIQFTLVDCPGHGSLIRTVLCGRFFQRSAIIYQGAQIIDLMLLVVDVTKGFQAQTAECLVIGSITCSQMIVVLNKCDLIESSKRAEQVERTDTAILPDEIKPEMNALISLLANTIKDPSEKRKQLIDRDFLFAVDHCFVVSGQGTVLTGTVLSGKLRLGDTLDIPQSREQRKVKSIQMFRQPVDSIGPGDRAGLCVGKLEADQIERGLVGRSTSGRLGSSSSNLSPCHACLLVGVERITYYKPLISAKSRLHVFVGHDTALAKLTFFQTSSIAASPDSTAELTDQLVAAIDNDHQQQVDGQPPSRLKWALLEFDRPILCPLNSLVIGAKLDTTSFSTCRLAFHGHVALQLTRSDYKQAVLANICVFRKKSRSGELDRVVDSRTCIVRGLFKRETNMEVFTGLQARLLLTTSAATTTDSGVDAVHCYSGRIEAAFGQSGKCRLTLEDELPDHIVTSFSSGKKSGGIGGGKKSPHDSTTPSSVQFKTRVVLDFKKHVFNPTRRIMQ